MGFYPSKEEPLLSVDSERWGWGNEGRLGIHIEMGYKDLVAILAFLGIKVESSSSLI